MWMLFLSSFINFCSFLRCFMKFDERNLKIFKTPLFYGNCGNVCPTDSDFVGLSRPLDVDLTENITVNISEVWSEFNIFCTLVIMAMAAILNLFNIPKAATHYGGYSYKFSWSLMKGINVFLNPPFFVSMATAAKFVQLIPICLAYLVPLDVDVVPIKFHQFLFGE